MTRCLCAVLFAAPAAAFPPPPKEKAEERPPAATQADWDRSANNLKQIGLAVHNYLSTNGHFPSDVLDKTGQPILSWRVHLLPFIEESALHKQFKLDEAWDGPTNKPLLEKMPKLFAPVRVRTKQAGFTFYQGFAGPDTMFDPKAPGLTVNQIPDGTSVTALAVEAGTAVEWTKPADVPFDPRKEIPKLGGHFDGEFHLLLCDGTVMAVRKDFHAEMMKCVIRRSDGTVVNLESLQK
jgi:hypothetical protein